MKSLSVVVLDASVVSPLAMAEWIEIYVHMGLCYRCQSPLAMAEWIEIGKEARTIERRAVSASDGGVD